MISHRNLQYCHIILYIILLYGLLINIVPNVSRSNIQGINVPAEYLEVKSRYLNEEYLKNPDMKIHKSELYPISQYDSWTAHHLSTPIYRALKTGLHLSNMGYNDALPRMNWDWQKTDTNTINYNYRSYYFSAFNNIAEIFYAILPADVRYIQTKADELRASQYMTKFRYALATFHLLSYLIIFIILLYKYNWIIAWSFGWAVLLSSGIFFGSLSLTGFTAGAGCLFIPIVYFYPLSMDKLFSRAYIYSTISFTVIHIFLLWIAQPLTTIMLTWAVAIAFTFAMDLSFTLVSTKSQSMFTKISFPIIRTSILVIVSFLPIFLIFALEIPQMSSWSGLSLQEVYNALFNRVSDTANQSLYLIYSGKKNEIIENWSDWMTHFRYSIDHISRNPIGTPLLSFETESSWLESLIPKKLYSIRLKVIMITGIIFQVFLAIFFKFNHLYRKYLLMSGIFIMAFIIYFIAFNFVSPRMSSHTHVSVFVYSLYIMLLYSMIIGNGITLIVNQSWLSKYFIQKK